MNEQLQTKLIENKNRQVEINGNIQSLPKGHINTLYRNNKGYYYLTHREGNKVKNDYLGPAGKADLNEIMSKLRQRELLTKELKELKKQEKNLIRLINKAK